MMNLNLVSQNIKNELKLKKTYDMVSRLLFFCTFISALFAGLMLYSKILLNIHLNNINERTATIKSNSSDYNTKVKELNQLIDYSGRVQAESTRWSCFLKDLFALSGKNVIRSVELDKAGGTISIRGHAKTRDDLLNFKEELENFENISGVTIPFNLLLSKENIEFDIKASLVKEKLKRY